MNRRVFLHGIVLTSISVVCLPSCDFETFPTYEHLPLSNDQNRLIRAIQESILPLGDLKNDLDDKPLDFMLSRINDCDEMSDVQKFQSGLQEFELYIQDQIDQDFNSQKKEQQLAIIESTLSETTIKPNLKFFIQRVRNLSIEHFTKSKYYQTTHLDYEFMPGRYLGCVAI